ncbi:SMI1/KNR4 family protein [Paenactinomyces guangxiensis]|uniref:SMI1/KNR4 family protein n=1 Tax=Paenactinomyces guangxiensis TaxID=1490290 RepID=A0A7W2A7A4_9BACL|nr:SMI1/KNR4 family protein [Paenactinomyces guangxiensis]MBA4492934.1 SMI1/KNR4 family protein [Paenactinomyces guangxiensis]MBH8590217.1 SMI1/KNR4 family protein [Paenactinomyces guangxiensis]
MKHLVYHEKALKLMNVLPIFSEKQAGLFEEKEKQFGRRLPEALRELYSVEGIVEWYGLRNQDFLHPLERLEPPVHLDAVELEIQGVPKKKPGNEAINFFVENQDCCSWAILLNASEDPPVIMHDYWEGKGEYVCERLSTFIYTYAWDALLCDSPYCMQGVSPSVSGQKLARLRRLFKEEPPTYEQSDFWTNYRFYDQDWRVLLENKPQQCHWWIAAGNKDSQMALIQELEPFTVEWDKN